MKLCEKLLSEYATHKPCHGQIDVGTMIDSERDRYQVLQVGWDGIRRVHGCTVHIDIIGDKVWIQYDGSSYPVAEALTEAGVPREALF